MVNETSLRQDIFKLFYDLINANKPDSTWAVRANVPDTDTAFPLIMVKPVKIDRKRIGVGIGTASDIAIRETFIELQVDIMSHFENGMVKVDEGKDNVHNTLTNPANLLTIYGDSIVFIDIQDSGMTDIIEINDQTYLTTTIISRWKL